MALRLRAPRLFRDGRFIGPASLVLDGGRIVAVSTGPDGNGPVGNGPVGNGPKGSEVVLPKGFLTAGMIDLQLNGAFGVDFGDPAAQDWPRVREALAATGVTAFAPTVITAGPDRLTRALREIDAAATLPGPGARVLGAHVEGPFLSPDHPGAHDPTLFTDPTPQALDALLAGPTPAILTLAPERRHALAAVARLSAAGCVVSVGHTAATATQVRAAVDAGARMVTHVFNAQRPLGHREPGTAGAALTDPRLTVGLIADLKHVAGPIVALTFRAAAGRVALVSDAVAVLGTVAGQAMLGGEPVTLDATRLPRRTDGTIAGSALRLDQAVRNAIGCGVEPEAALEAVTRTPADLLGRADLGRLEPGAAADLIWWDDDLTIREVWLDGVPLGLTRAARE